MLQSYTGVMSTALCRILTRRAVHTLNSATHHIESISAGIWCLDTSQEETNKHVIVSIIKLNRVNSHIYDSLRIYLYFATISPSFVDVIMMISRGLLVGWSFQWLWACPSCSLDCGSSQTASDAQLSTHLHEILSDLQNNTCVLLLLLLFIAFLLKVMLLGYG